MLNILVLSYCNEYPVRPTIWDALYSFERYGNCRCVYLNLAVQNVPPSYYQNKNTFDAVVYQTTFLSTRWCRELFLKQVERIRPLKKLDAVHVALPQDEFIHTDLLCDFINEFNVSLLYSSFDQPEWPKVYPTVDLRVIEIQQALTGYIDERYLSKMQKIRNNQNRSIDLGYRAWHAAYWLGRHGQKKTEIARKFREAAKGIPFKLDISTKAEDTLTGNKWFEFLGNCNSVLGVEGGSSIIDVDGSIMRRTEDYVAKHPSASFLETEKRCFADEDGKLNGFALSPRHFEAILTGTCQVLLKGSYNNVFVPGEHYIEIAEDYSNLSSVFSQMADDGLRQKLTNQAYDDIVRPGRYTYRRFVENVLKDIARYRVKKSSNKLSRAKLLKSKTFNQCSWSKVLCLSKARQLRNWMRKKLPSS